MARVAAVWLTVVCALVFDSSLVTVHGKKYKEDKPAIPTESPGPQLTWTLPELEVIFVLGSSKTIGLDHEGEAPPANWLLILKFVRRQITEVFPGVRFGIMIFGDYARTVLRLAEFTSTTDALSYIGETSYEAGKRNLNDALYLLWSDSFTPISGSNPEAIKLAIIITDGEDNLPKKGSPLTLTNATMCKAKGIHIDMLVVTHIKEDINMKRWQLIVSDPKQGLHVVDSFEELAYINSSVHTLSAGVTNIVHKHPAGPAVGPLAERPYYSSSADVNKYQLTVFTACKFLAGTSSKIKVVIFDHNFKSDEITLTPPGGEFKKGSVAMFDIDVPTTLTQPWLSFSTDKAGFAPDWLLWKAVLNDFRGETFFYLDCYCWINNKHEPLTRPMVPVSVSQAMRIMSEKCK